MGVILLLLALTALLAVAWSSFRTVLLSGALATGRPILRALHLSPALTPAPCAWTPPHGNASPDLASRVRRMEFRIHQYQVSPATLQSWCAEWSCTPAEKNLLPALLLRELPEAAARETPAILQVDLAQSILTFTAERRKTEPDNGFFWLADALALLHSNQDAASLLALNQARNGSAFRLPLREWNHSEMALAFQHRNPWTLFPSMPPWRGLALERPLYSLSRSLALKQRAFLKKYNFEKANETALLHLQTAALLAEMAWTPSDLAVARAMAARALEPYWNGREVEPTFADLQKYVAGFMEDQGDRLSASKIRVWTSAIETRQARLQSNLATWRRLQLLAVWNAPSVLGSLSLALLTLLAAWLAAMLGTRRPSVTPPVPSAFREIAGVLFFALPPVIWTVLGWPPGPRYLLLGLAASWLLWTWLHMAPRAMRPDLAENLGRTLAGALTLLILTATAAGLALTYEQHHLGRLLQDGLLNATIR